MDQKNQKKVKVNGCSNLYYLEAVFSIKGSNGKHPVFNCSSHFLWTRDATWEWTTSGDVDEEEAASPNAGTAPLLVALKVQTKN